MIEQLPTNRSVLSAQHFYRASDKNYRKTLEKTSSGLQINHPSDNPAKFLYSEKLRTNLSGFEQSIKNNDLAIQYVQAMESGLEQVNQSLLNIKKVVVQTANDAALDEFARVANQDEISRSLTQIDSIVENLRFGQKPVFSNQNTISGQVNSTEWKVLDLQATNLPVGQSDHSIEVLQYPTFSTIVASRNLEEKDNTEEPLRLNFLVGQKQAEFVFNSSLSLQHADQELNSFFYEQDLPLNAVFDGDGLLRVQHDLYGSEHQFQVLASDPSFFGVAGAALAIAGQDIVTNIGGKRVVGSGNEVQGTVGQNAGAFRLQWNPGESFDPAQIAEVAQEPVVLSIKNNPYSFHVGRHQGDNAELFLTPLNTEQLGTGVANSSGFKSLKQIGISNFDQTQDSLLVVDAAIAQLTAARAKIGVFQRDILESSQNQQREQQLAYFAGESEIRDADMAQQVADIAKGQLMYAAAGQVIKTNLGEQGFLRLLRG